MCTTCTFLHSHSFECTLHHISTSSIRIKSHYSKFLIGWFQCHWSVVPKYIIRFLKFITISTNWFIRLQYGRARIEMRAQLTKWMCQFVFLFISLLAWLHIHIRICIRMHSEKERQIIIKCNQTMFCATGLIYSDFGETLFRYYSIRWFCNKVLQFFDKLYLVPET